MKLSALTLIVLICVPAVSWAGALTTGTVIEVTKDKLVVRTDAGEKIEFVPSKNVKDGVIHPLSTFRCLYKDVALGDRLCIEHMRVDKTNEIQGLRLISKLSN